MFSAVTSFRPVFYLCIRSWQVSVPYILCQSRVAEAGDYFLTHTKPHWVSIVFVVVWYLFNYMCHSDSLGLALSSLCLEGPSKVGVPFGATEGHGSTGVIFSI